MTDDELVKAMRERARIRREIRARIRDAQINCGAKHVDKSTDRIADQLEAAAERIDELNTELRYTLDNLTLAEAEVSNLKDIIIERGEYD